MPCALSKEKVRRIRIQSREGEGTCIVLATRNKNKIGTVRYHEHRKVSYMRLRAWCSPYARALTGTVSQRRSKRGIRFKAKGACLRHTSNLILWGFPACCV